MDDVTQKFDVVTQTEVSVSGPEVKKKDLIIEVAERTGLKKGMVKQALEATLAVMGETLVDGNVLNLQPLGKMQVLNQKDTPNATILKCKIRQVKAEEDRGEDTDTDDTAADVTDAAPVMETSAEPPRGLGMPPTQTPQERLRRKVSLSSAAAE